MSKHRHEYFDVPDPASNLISWTVKRNDLFANATEESPTSESDVAPFQPVYVIPHMAVSEMSQWSRSNQVTFVS